MSTFRAMNTDVAVVAPGVDEPRVTEAVARIFADAEARFSRFRDDSELARLNRTEGPIVVSAAMFDALVAARRHVEITGGIFDPAIGGTLIALGYDRSFEPGALDRDTDVAAPRSGSFLDVQLDPARREVTRPVELQVDLGGMIKGRTVDEAAACLPRDGAIDAGGDAVLRGGGPDGWLVEIEDPREATRTIARLRVRDGAVATSAANRRRWQVAGAARHHLVDPRTQRSAATDLLQVTILAPTAELADVLAKTVFVLGVEAGRGFLERWPEIGAILVCATGAPIVCGLVDMVVS
jgi:thiamine biosynthesis lipoprotein